MNYEAPAKERVRMVREELKRNDQFVKSLRAQLKEAHERIAYQCPQSWDSNSPCSCAKGEGHKAPQDELHL